MYNLLEEKLITATTTIFENKKYTLPGILAAIFRGEIEDFPRLMPHQRHALHTFLVQLAALALVNAKSDVIPTHEGSWRILLIGLTSKFPQGEAYSLIAPVDKPAFLQPPIPSAKLEGFKQVDTPDRLDMLILSKNHDLKVARLPANDPELWLYALLTLQTQEGFLGAGNYGISRMNGGFSSRSNVALSIDGSISETICRDVAGALKLRSEQNSKYGLKSTGGHALLWLEPWDGSTSLDYKSLDLYYIEICRRVRLDVRGNSLIAFVGNSKVARVEAGALKGVTGDLWATILHDKSGSKALTVDSRGFSYQQIDRICFGDQSITGAPLAKVLETDPLENLVILCRALVRGQGKTEGHHERRIPVSRKMRTSFMKYRDSDPVAATVHDRVRDAATFARHVLYPALMAICTGAPRARLNERLRDDDNTKSRANRLVQHFESLVDATFFQDLNEELECLGETEAMIQVRSGWISHQLRTLGKNVLDEAFERVPGAAVRNLRIRSQAQDVFQACFNKQFGARLALARKESEEGKNG